MKSTGVIRRIDDLGRVVIPKEIRKNLRIREGDNLEVFVNGEEVILKKYSLMNKISDISNELTDSIYTFIKHNIFITDTDTIVAASGPLKKEYLNKSISENLVESIKRRENYVENHFKELHITEDSCKNCSYVISTIIASGEAVGLILIVSENEQLGDTESKMAYVASSFMTKYLEQ